MAQDFQPIRNYGGSQLLVGVQTNLYTPIAVGSCKNVRYESIDAYPTIETQTKQQSNQGHRNDADYSDQYTPWEYRQDDSLVFKTRVRKSSNDATTDPPEVTFLESGNYEVVEGSATTLVSYTPATGVAVLTADVFGANKKNVAVMLQFDDGVYRPVLFSDYVSATKTGTAAVKWPGAATAGNIVDRCYTCVPMLGKVSAAKLLTFHLLGLGPSFQFTGCALSSWELSEIVPNGDLEITWTFHVTDVVKGTQAMAADSFQDLAADLILPGASVHYADYAAAAALSEVIIQRAKIINPYKVRGMDGVGNTTSVMNETQGYACYKSEKGSPDSPVGVELDQIHDTQDKTDYTAKTWKALQITRSTTSLDVPSVLISVPKMQHQSEPSVSEDDTLGCYFSKNVFRGTSPAWGANNDPADRGNRDLVIAFSGNA